MKYILTDIDGVCLDWSKQFNKFLAYYYPDVTLKDPTKDYEHVEHIMNDFCRSTWMGWCEPLRDAVEVLTKLKAEGYEVHGCTAMGNDPYAIASRKTNLERFFPNVFNRLDTTPMDPGVTKEKWLEQYRNKECVWVEDKWINAKAGANMGLKTFLMKHPYNAQHDDVKVTKVDNWQQIYYYIHDGT